MFSFRNLLVDHVQDIGKALSTLDKCQLGSVSLHKMQQVLQECGCPLQEEELAALLNRSLGFGFCSCFGRGQVHFSGALQRSPHLPLGWAASQGLESAQSNKKAIGQVCGVS